MALKGIILLNLVFWVGMRSLYASEPSIEIWENLGDPKNQKHALEVTGYIIANEFGDGKISEFLFTQSPGGCVHVPLPPPSRLIHVTMQKGHESEIFFGKRVILKGKLEKGSRMDASFEMSGDEVRLNPYIAK